MPSDRKTLPTKIRTRKVAAGAFVRKRRRIITLDLRRKLGEVVNAESLLDSGYLVHHLFKSVFAEEFVFFLLEIFAERIEFMRQNDLSKSRKKNSVLAGFMRIVHADELLHGSNELRPLGFIPERLQIRESQSHIRDTPTGLVLRAKHFYQVDEPIRFFEARKEKIFFELLMIILDKMANNSRSVSQSFGRKILFRIEAAQRFAVNQKHAF